MELTLNRKYKKADYTIGVLSVNGRYFCETLEDTDRGLKSTDSIDQIRSKKKYGETAIPTGKYVVRMDIVSQKYKNVFWANELCGGKMPRLMDVKGYDGILIHPGNTPKDSLGCILVGENKAKGKVLNSRVTFLRLYQDMKSATDRGESIILKII